VKNLGFQSFEFINLQVQTEDQYIFIYDAILEAVICGNSEIPVDKLQAHVEMLTTPLPGENFKGIDVEFKVAITILLNILFVHCIYVLTGCLRISINNVLLFHL